MAISRALLVLTLAIGVAPVSAAQGTSGPLNAARELYAAARYDEALSLLDGLGPTQAPGERLAIDQYRSLCLLALGRGTEAEDAIAAVVTSDPMYQPSEADASPRVRTAFTDVRQRLLPQIAMSQYGAAKRRYDRKEYAEAAEHFRRVLRLLDDPDMKGQQADLRVLASGFLDLSLAAAAPPPAPKREAAPPPPAASAAVPPADRVYTADDPGVTPAVAIKQDMPRVPASISTQVRDRGVIEIVVDELGRVIVVAIRASLHPMYDNLLLSSAREWRYQPATFAGTPVKFRKLIQVSLAKR